MRNNIPIKCRTNIDCAKNLRWPSFLPESPVVGDCIRSLSSTETKCIEMVVCQCTWCESWGPVGNKKEGV